MKKILHPSNAERQKIYNRRYREKQSAIRRLCGELDRQVRELEGLPKCSRCRPGCACDHTAERRHQLGAADRARAQLAELDH